MRALRTLLLLAVLCSCGGAAPAPPARSPAVRPPAASPVAEIDARCDRIAALTADDRRRRLFATISADDIEPAEASRPWQEYADDAALEPRLKVLGRYEIAELWRADDGATYVRTTATSDTGDWLHLTRYCYRDDGTLARTFFVAQWYDEEGGTIGTRTRHFARDGRQLATAADLQRPDTGKKPEPGEFGARESLYKQLSKQPFAGLLAR